MAVAVAGELAVAVAVEVEVEISITVEVEISIEVEVKISITVEVEISIEVEVEISIEVEVEISNRSSSNRVAVVLDIVTSTSCFCLIAVSVGKQTIIVTIIKNIVTSSVLHVKIIIV